MSEKTLTLPDRAQEIWECVTKHPAATNSDVYIAALGHLTAVQSGALRDVATALGIFAEEVSAEFLAGVVQERVKLAEEQGQSEERERAARIAEDKLYDCCSGSHCEGYGHGSIREIAAAIRGSKEGR